MAGRADERAVFINTRALASPPLRDSSAFLGKYATPVPGVLHTSGVLVAFDLASPSPLTGTRLSANGKGNTEPAKIDDRGDRALALRLIRRFTFALTLDSARSPCGSRV